MSFTCFSCICLFAAEAERRERERLEDLYERDELAAKLGAKGKKAQEDAKKKVSERLSKDQHEAKVRSRSFKMSGYCHFVLVVFDELRHFVISFNSRSVIFPHFCGFRS